MTKAPSIDFYFDFISPFGWIAAEKIGAIGRMHGRSVDWHPFLLKVSVVDTMGLRPILQTPLKGAYSWHDAHRSARLNGLSISDRVKPSFSPVNASRAVIWAKSRGMDVEKFVLALYRRHWRDGGDISEPDQISEVASRNGFDGEAISAAIAKADVKQAFHAEVAAAIERGVFGSPTTIVDGEMFWGSDRLQQVDKCIAEGPW